MVAAFTEIKVKVKHREDSNPRGISGRRNLLGEREQLLVATKEVATLSWEEKQHEHFN